MVIVSLIRNKKTKQYSFSSFADALIFARSKRKGTRFEIREGKVLLAKGAIENYKE